MRFHLCFGVFFLTACTTEKEVENNVAPEFTNLWLEPTDGITTSTQLYCVANAIDGNDDPILLDYTWRNSAGEIVSDTWDFTLSPELVQPTEELTCTATISDEEFTVEQSISVTVENTAPEILSMAVSPDTIVNDSLLTCTVEAIDADLETLNISYSWIQGTTELGTDQTLQLSNDILVGSDPISCTVTVEDGYGGMATQMVETEISNRTPIIGSVILSPNPAFETDSILCETTDIIDADGDEVVISYEWAINGIVQTNTDMLEGAFTVDDVIRCSATPSDGFASGATVSAETTIDNALPSIDNLTLDATTITTDSTVNVTTTTSNLENSQTVTVEYEWHVVESSGTDNIIQTGATSTLDSALFVSGQTIYVVATPNDGLEDGASVTSDMIMVGNSTPTDLLATVTSDNNFYNDSTLTCSATANDLDVNDGVDTLSYTYTWSTGDTGTILVLDGSLVPNTDVSCTVEATDGTDTISIGVINTLANRIPSVSAILPTGVTAETGSVFCDATATDPDTTVPTLTYTWAVDSTPVSEVSDTLSGPFVLGSTIECIVEASDGIDTDTANASTTVGNTAPMVGGVSVGPTTAYTDSTLTVAAVLSDVDAAHSSALTATYEWHVVAPSGNDTLLAGQVTESLSNSTLNEFFMKGDSVYVIATPNDGVDDGSPVTSNIVEILNSIPSTPTISVYGFPNDPAVEGEDDLMCDIDTPSTDVDGDAITYTYVWSDDASGSSQQTTADVSDLSDTFLGINTIAGDWTCTVVANDGEENSASVSEGFTVDSAFVSIFVYGTIAGQDGWSGMTNSGAQTDSFPSGTMVSGDSDDRGDSIVGIGLPETGAVFSGNQAWWFRRGYDSAGSGTPYTPDLTPNTTDTDGDGVADQGFQYEISFKAANESGDGSRMGVITGDAAGIDRASNYLEIFNDVGNLYIRSYANGAYNTLIDNLDSTVWHTIEATMYRDGVLDYWTYSVNGVQLTTDEIGYFCDFRVSNGFGYVESTRLKFQPRHSNYDANFQGFFFDELRAETLDSTTGMIIDSYSTGFE